MLIKFDPTRIGKQFENVNLQQFAFARKLKKILMSVRASSSEKTFYDTGLFEIHPLNGNLKGCHGISVTANIRLVLSFATFNGQDMAIVKGVCDYHGSKINWYIP